MRIVKIETTRAREEVAHQQHQEKFQHVLKKINNGFKKLMDGDITKMIHLDDGEMDDPLGLWKEVWVRRSFDRLWFPAGKLTMAELKLVRECECPFEHNVHGCGGFADNPIYLGGQEWGYGQEQVHEGLVFHLLKIFIERETS